MNYCNSCGYKLLPDSTFCGSCGTKLVDQKNDNQSSKSNQGNYQDTGYQSHQNSKYQQNSSYGYNMGYRNPRKEPILTALISFMFPGIGYGYLDEWGKAIGYFILITILYLIIIGFFIHIYVVVDGYNKTKEYNQSIGYPE